MALSLALFAASCGDDSDSESSSTAAAPSATTAAGGSTATTAPSSPTTKAAAASGTPIKIGIVAGLSGGSEAAASAGVATADAWVASVNDAGGIAGHQIELIKGDSKGDAATAQTVVKDLVETKKIVAMVYYDTPTEGSVGAYLAEKNIPVFGANGYNTELWGKLPNFFNLHTTIPGTVQSGSVAASALGFKNFSAMSCAEIVACKQAELVYEPMAKALGLTYSGLVTVAGAAPNYTAECLSLIGKGTDWMQLSLVTAVSTRVMADCLQQGYKGVFGISATGYEQNAWETVPGAKFGGSTHAFPWWANAPGPQAFRDAMAKYQPKVDYRSAATTAVWASLEYFKKAVSATAKSGVDVTSDEVFNGAYSLKDETLGGMLPQPVTIVKGQPSALVSCFFLYTFNVGDKQPTLHTFGKSGNGATGDLQSSCVPT